MGSKIDVKIVLDAIFIEYNIKNDIRMLCVCGCGCICVHVCV